MRAARTVIVKFQMRSQTVTARGPRFLDSVALILTLVLGTAMIGPESTQAQIVDDGAVRPVFRTRTVSGGRVDIDSRVMRARYTFEESTQESVDEIMRRAASEFGWAENLSDLELVRSDVTDYSTHLTYRQRFKGIPVEGRFVKLSLNRAGQPTMLISGYTPLTSGDDVDPIPVQSASRARVVAMAAFAAAGGRAAEPELVFTAEPAPRLVWKVIVWPADEPAEWVVYVSAADGSVVASYDQSVSRRSDSRKTGSAGLSGGLPGGLSGVLSSRAAPSADNRPRGIRAYSGAPPGSLSRISGTGFVFDPDPLTTAGVPYSAPYVDSNDGAVAELDAERLLVTLPDVSVNGSGMYVLEGPFAKIVGENQVGTTTYVPPAVLTPDDFRFSRSEDGFEAVNAYYHVDKSQRYLQSLGITNRRNSAFRINPLGLTGDDSFYFPSADMIVLGAGVVDDAEDATIIWHEYAHALLDAITPNLFSTKEGEAYHEGWADYWAASYARFLTESSQVGRTDWERLFRWDSGDGTIWAGRVLDDFDRYPDGVCSALPGTGSCSVHDDGRLWATTMMEVYTELGREVTDILNVRSHLYLSSPLTFSDAAQAIIQADLDFFSGAHLSVLVGILGARGLIDAANLGPSIAHIPLGWTEDVGGIQTVGLEAIGLSDPVVEVRAFYQIGGGFWNSTKLSQTSDNSYEGVFDLPSSPATIAYYVQAVDTGDRVRTLPDNAPVTTFQFTVGPDLEPPQLTHDPIEEGSFIAWPPVVTATASDNLGVSGVIVSYRIEASSGEELEAGDFNLEFTGNGTPVEGEWQASFPVEVAVLEVNARVFYTLTATDGSVSRNTTTLPGNGLFSFEVVSNGTFAAHDFDGSSPGITLTGLFESGAPSFGLKVAHSDLGVAGTSLSGAYPDQPGFSFMQIPPVNLTGLGDVFLVFWHWYDTEHDGSGDPGSNSALLFDGGNVKVSVDGGQTWELLVPEGGYRGSVATSPLNPLSGEPAFGGYSYGWRQEIAPLPTGPDVRVRFEFGTDSDNSEVANWFAGWFIDDIRITQLRPVDSGAPAALEIPQSLQALSIGQRHPRIEVRLIDDNGIANVFADYSFTGAGSATTGTVRFEMDPGRLSYYRGTFDFITDPSPSDRLTYTIRAQDHMGNETIFASPSSAPFQIDYFLFDTQAVFQSVETSGVWDTFGSGWIAASATPDGSENTEANLPAILSSINLIPIDLPSNANDSRLVVSHSYRIFDKMGGNVKISDDSGQSWRILEPQGGYDSDLVLPSEHQMSGEPGFTGVQDASVSTVFPLDAFGGRQVRIRIDFAATRAFFDDERWTLGSIEYVQTTGEESFDIERVLALHANYPNPFSSSTRISFTLEEAGNISVKLYDLTGRLVQTVLTGFLEAGSYEETLVAGNLAGGMYFLRLRSHGRSADRSIVLVR